jgi:hypothetical protein
MNAARAQMAERSAESCDERSSADSDEWVRGSSRLLLCNAGSARCVVVAHALAQVQSHDEEKKGRRSGAGHTLLPLTD